VENNIILVILAILSGMIAVAMLYNEWGRLSGKDRKLYNWMKAYIPVIIISNIVIIVFKEMFYQNTDIYNIVREIILTSILWVSAATDMKYNKIPNLFVILGVIGWVVVTIWELATGYEYWMSNFVSSLIAVVIIAFVMGMCLLIMKNSIGMGDVKIILVMSALLGLANVLVAIFVSLIVSFIAAVFLLVTKKKGRKDTLPFAPFILTGTLMSIILLGV
jgi:prepilin signal peptidase PulO-like enzyme (type II secretory pathway)